MYLYNAQGERERKMIIFFEVSPSFQYKNLHYFNMYDIFTVEGKKVQKKYHIINYSISYERNIIHEIEIFIIKVMFPEAFLVNKCIKSLKYYVFTVNQNLLRTE